MDTLGVRHASACAAGAGAAWLAVWAHQAAAHGTTQLNEEEVVLGLTWMDAGKFLVIPFALLSPVTRSLAARGHPLGRLGRTGSALTSAALFALVVGVALEFWSSPTPVLPVPGIAWLVLGGYLLRASPSEVRF